MPYKQPQRIDQNPLLPSAHWGRRSQPQRGAGHDQDRPQFQQGATTEHNRNEQQQGNPGQGEPSKATSSIRKPEDLDLGPAMPPLDIEETGSMVWSEERHRWVSIPEPEEVVDDENTGTRIGHCDDQCRGLGTSPYNQPPSSLDRRAIPIDAEVEYISLPRRTTETRPSGHAECPFDTPRVEDNEYAYDGDSEGCRPCRQHERHQTSQDLLFNEAAPQTLSVDSPNSSPRALRVLMDDPDYGHLIAGRNAARYMHLRTRPDELLYPLIAQMVEEIEGELLDLVDTFQARWHEEHGFSYMEDSLYPGASGDAMMSAEQAMVLRRDENARKDLEQQVRSSMQNADLDVSAARQPASAAKKFSSSKPPQELPDAIRRKPMSTCSSRQPIGTASDVRSELNADEAAANRSRSGWPSQPQRLVTNLKESKNPRAPRVRWAEELGLESPYVCSDPARKQAFLMRRVRDRADTLPSGTSTQECESERVQTAGPSTLKSRSHDSPARDVSSRPNGKGRVDLGNFVAGARKRWF